MVSKAKVANSWDQPKTAEPTGPRVGFLVVKKIISEEVPVYAGGGGGGTIGDMIDARLSQMIREGADILEVSYQLDPADAEARAMVREMYAGEAAEYADNR